MRILVLDTIYQAFAERLYAQTPGLAERSYLEQRQAIWDGFFGTSDAYVRHLAELGHETDGAIVNWAPLQRQWLAERRLPKGVSALAHRLPGRPGQLAAAAATQLTVLAQVRAFRPQVLFVHDLWSLGPRELDWLRRSVPFIVGQIASPAPPLETVARYDLMLTSFPHFVQRFRTAGIDAELFGLGYYDRVGARLEAEGRSTDASAPDRQGVVFIGGVAPSSHPSPALELLCRELPVDVYGYGVEELPSDSAIRARFRGPAWGLDMYRHLAGARIAINRHAWFAEGYANNMRLYEATGMGATVVTEAAPNLHALFTPGVELETYASPQELVDKTGALLDDDAPAVRIAAAGQAHTLEEHTYAHRMRELSALLEDRYAAGRFRSRTSR